MIPWLLLALWLGSGVLLVRTPSCMGEEPVTDWDGFTWLTAVVLVVFSPLFYALALLQLGRIGLHKLGVMRVFREATSRLDALLDYLDGYDFR